MKHFNQIVTIKEFREEKAGLAVISQRRVFDKAVVQREEAGRKLREFQDYAKEEETRIYRELCARVVRVRDIEDAKTSVLILRGDETDHRKHLEEAEQRRRKEEKQLVEDRATHAVARTTRDKFLELADVFAQEARDAAERFEEAQIEEAAETRRPAAHAAGTVDTIQVTG